MKTLAIIYALLGPPRVEIVQSVPVAACHAFVVALAAVPCVISVRCD